MKLRLTPSKAHAATRKRKGDAFHLREHEMQVAVFKWSKGAALKYPELAYMYAIPNGFPLMGMTIETKSRVVNYMKAEGLRPGALDICLPTPRFFIETVFHGLYVEMKVPGGVVSKDQEEMADFLYAQGYFVVICRSIKEAIDAITKYLELEKV